MGKITVRHAAGVVLLIAAVLAVAGCGGGKKSSAPPPPVTVTVAETTPATTTTAATTAENSGGVSSLGNCRDLAGFGQTYSKALAAATKGGGGFAAQADVFKSFADKAPAEIRDQFQIFAAAIAKYAEVLKGLNYKPGQTPSPEVIAKLTAASKEINQPAVQAAVQKISAWAASHCHP